MKNIEINFIHLHKNGRLFGFGVSPNADWKVLFVFFFIILTIVLSLGIFLFVKINNGSLFVVKTETSAVAPKINVDQLSRTIEYYDERAKNLEDIRKNKVSIPDPSL